MVLIGRIMSFGGLEFGPKPDFGGECSWTNYFSSDYFSGSNDIDSFVSHNSGQPIDNRVSIPLTGV